MSGILQEIADFSVITNSMSFIYHVIYQLYIQMHENKTSACQSFTHPNTEQAAKILLKYKQQYTLETKSMHKTNFIISSQKTKVSQEIACRNPKPGKNHHV